MNSEKKPLAFMSLLIPDCKISTFKREFHSFYLYCLKVHVADRYFLFLSDLLSYF